MCVCVCLVKAAETRWMRMAKDRSVWRTFRRSFMSSSERLSGDMIIEMLQVHCPMRV